MDYLTIDFETANHRLTSACSIGIVGVENNKIIFKEHYLINPEEEFNDYNINIHHIHPEDVQGALRFDELWEIIKDYFTNTIVFAHNASFDIAVLKAMIDKYNLEIPNIKFGCTCKIASKLWNGELINLKLNTIALFLELDHQHHNALSDALVCVEIINRGQRVMGVCSANELYEILGIRYGVYNEKRFYPSMNKYVRKSKVEIVENEQLTDKVIYLSGKPLTTTRRKLMDGLISNGVYLEKNINLSLDYFVKMQNSPKLHLEIVQKLIKSGAPITVISEEEILKLIK